MGFIDHVTNNIILDCVLTDFGRQALSKNDKSFSFIKFAVGDDEVDYSIIQKFGRSVGKEKIEKNTPVFEAITNQLHSLKYKLISISNPNLIRLPILALTGGAAATGNNTIELGRTSQKSKNVEISQTIQNETSIDVELRDQTFIVDIDNQFLEIVPGTPVSISSDKRATYILRRSSSETALGGSIVKFTLSLKSITNAQFTVYGMIANKNIIVSYVRITGSQSGQVIELKVNISK